MENKCFVIMPFSKTIDIHDKYYWEKFYIELSNVITSMGYDCHRASSLGESITSHIINNLYDCCLVIAILTDKNANVFYELGVRHTLGSNTIMLMQENQNIPFDITNYPVIKYEDDIPKKIIESIKEELIIRIKAINEVKIDNPVHEALPMVKKFNQLKFPEDKLGYITYTRDISNSIFSFPNIFQEYCEEIFIVAPNNDWILSIPQKDVISNTWVKRAKVFDAMIKSLLEGKQRHIEILLSDFIDLASYRHLKYAYNMICPDYGVKKDSVIRSIKDYDEYIKKHFGEDGLNKIKNYHLLEIRVIRDYYFESMCFVDSENDNGKMYILQHHPQISANQKPVFYIEKRCNEEIYQILYEAYHQNLWRNEENKNMRIIWPLN